MELFELNHNANPLTPVYHLHHFCTHWQSICITITILLFIYHYTLPHGCIISYSSH